MVLLAGPITSRIVDPDTYHASDGEDERVLARDWVTSVYGSPQELLARFATLERKVERLLSRKDIWTRTTALAYALLERKKIPARDVNAIIESVPGVATKTARSVNERLRKISENTPERVKKLWGKRSRKNRPQST
jgi:hypothetical protein